MCARSRRASSCCGPPLATASIGSPRPRTYARTIPRLRARWSCVSRRCAAPRAMRRFRSRSSAAASSISASPPGWTTTIFAASASAGTRRCFSSSADVQLDPERLRPLVDNGVVVQLTAASLDGRLGGAPRAAARRLLDARLAHLVASDAHAPDIRSVGLSGAARATGDEALAHWLTEDVPAALLAGRPLPDPAGVAEAAVPTTSVVGSRSSARTSAGRPRTAPRSP